MKSLTSLFLLCLLPITTLSASSFEVCEYIVRLKELTKSEVILKLVQVTKDEGMVMNQCKKFFTGNTRKLAATEFTEPLPSELKTEQNYLLKYSNYGAMGPNGPVSSRKLILNLLK